MNFDDQLGNLSLAELKSLQKQIDRAIETHGAKQRQAALEAIRAKAEEHGFKLDDLVDAGFTKTRKAMRPPSKFYVNPNNPEQRWSGRGRRPSWILEIEAAGQQVPQVDA